MPLQKLKIRLCTWNVGGWKPSADLSGWLGKDEVYDIIVVGAQEANISEKAPSPTSVSDTPVKDGQESSNTNGSSGVSVATPPRRLGLKRISRALRNSRKSKSSVRKERKLVGEDIRSIQIEHELTETAVEEGCDGQKAGSAVDHRKDTDSLDMELKGVKVKNEEVLAETVSWSTFMVPKMKNSRFRVLDESAQDGDISVGSVGNVRGIDDANGKIFSSNEDVDVANCRTDATMGSATEELYISRSSRRRGKGRGLKSMATIRRTLDEEEELTPTAGEKKFWRVVTYSLPSGYNLVAKHHLMGIKLLVYTHERLKPEITKIKVVSEATGLGNFVGNKGGVAVKMTLDDTSFCFVVSHLAAHEGANFLERRNEDVMRIMRSIEMDGRVGLPILHQFDHIFWMGDLNYRLDLKDLLPHSAGWSHEQRFEYVCDLIGQKRYDDIVKFDELGRERENGIVFGTFSEGKIDFAPTFKTVRGVVSPEYQMLRVPSYCDRILWHSLPFHRNHVKQMEYACVSEVVSSDHKPVYAVFEVQMPSWIRHLGLPAPENSLKCTVDFLRIHVMGLYEKRGDHEYEDGRSSEAKMNGSLFECADGNGTISPVSQASYSSNSSHTRRLVTASFEGHGMFAKDRGYKAEIPLRDGRREARYSELPAIALWPVGDLKELEYKYMTVSFHRVGSKTAYSCVVPMAKMATPGKERMKEEFELSRFGEKSGRMYVEVELVVSGTTWIDQRNKMMTDGRKKWLQS